MAMTTAFMEGCWGGTKRISVAAEWKMSETPRTAAASSRPVCLPSMWGRSTEYAGATSTDRFSSVSCHQKTGSRACQIRPPERRLLSLTSKPEWWAPHRRPGEAFPSPGEGRLIGFDRLRQLRHAEVL